VIQLGARVRDVVSGAEGVLMCRCEWLNGCVRSSFQPPVDKDGKVPELVTVDDEQLQVLQADPIVLPGQQDAVLDAAAAGVVSSVSHIRRVGGGRDDAAALRR